MSDQETRATPAELVGAFADAARRIDAFTALIGMGAEALPAIREGLNHGNWQVRRWCAMCLDQVADAESLRRLVPLLRDPKSQVRMWAVHAIACDHCKDGVTCPVDLVPMLIERIEQDESIRVRRMATVMLATEFVDARARPVLERIVKTEEDRKLRLHAEQGLRRYDASGLHA